MRYNRFPNRRRCRRLYPADKNNDDSRSILFFVLHIMAMILSLNNQYRVDAFSSKALHRLPARAKKLIIVSTAVDDDTIEISRRQTIKTITQSFTGIILSTFLSSPIAVFAVTPSTKDPSSNKALSEEYRQGTAALSDMDDLAPVPRDAYQKLPSGIVIADLRPGNKNVGTAKDGSKVNIQWVLRKSNGYFVDSSQVANDGVPFIFTVGDGTAIAGVDEGIRGMSVGGVRRLLIPPSLAYVDGLEDGKPGPLPMGFGPRQQMRRVMQVRKDVPGEYIFLEVQLTRVR